MHAHMNPRQQQTTIRVLVISMGTAMSRKILDCIARFEAFTPQGSCTNATTGLEMIAAGHPELVFVVAPLPNRALAHLIKTAKQAQPAIRIVIVADWTEFTGFARASQKGADGFISARFLPMELPLFLGQYPQLAATWGQRFSPWKAGYGMA